MTEPGSHSFGQAEPGRAEFMLAYQQVRARTAGLVAPLTVEDCVIQSMPDVSPTKWHLAHTSWFFEAFLLETFVPCYRPVDPTFEYLFNSYYLQVGGMHPREQRGLVSRPGHAQVLEYRRVIDERVLALMASASADDWNNIARLVELGMHHEQQHQELLLMDIKHVFWCNPNQAAYRATAPLETHQELPMQMQEHAPGLTEIGHEGPGFSFDNESPRHKVFVHPFQIANRCVTNREFAAFIDDEGYARSEHWLADGFAHARQQDWQAPLYWQRDGDEWLEFRLAGLQPIDPNSPVVHLSYYEADAYARWAGCRLPTEAEWEVAASSHTVAGNFVETGHLHPRPALPTSAQFFGDVWEFTASAYAAYPGYQPPKGAIGEYNGKFMSGQMVLRGGSCVTPQSHMRASYRNFFHPHKRWGFQGLRLAADR